MPRKRQEEPQQGFPYDVLCVDENADLTKFVPPQQAGVKVESEVLKQGAFTSTRCIKCSKMMECDFGVRISLARIKFPLPE